SVHRPRRSSSWRERCCPGRPFTAAVSGLAAADRRPACRPGRCSDLGVFGDFLALLFVALAGFALLLEVAAHSFGACDEGGLVAQRKGQPHGGAGRICYVNCYVAN